MHALSAAKAYHLSKLLEMQIDLKIRGKGKRNQCRYNARMRVFRWKPLGALLVASIAMGVAAMPANAASIPGTDMARDFVRVSGPFITWYKDNAMIQCDPDDPVLNLAQPNYLVDLRTGIRTTLSSKETGVVGLGVTSATRSFGGNAFCDGSGEVGTYDMDSLSFTAYSSLPEAADPASIDYSMNARILGNELVDLWPDAGRGTRIDLVSGRLRTIGGGGLSAFDGAIARAANGDVVWITNSSSRCSSPTIRRWSYDDNTVTVTTTTRRPFKSSLSGREVLVSYCKAWLDPDTGRLYSMSRRIDPFGSHDGGLTGPFYGRFVAFQHGGYGTEECCLLILNTATGVWSKVPRTSPTDRVVALSAGRVIWEKENSSGQTYGALQQASIGSLPKLVNLRYTKRSGSRLSFVYQTNGTGMPAWIVRWRNGAWRSVSPQKWSSRGTITISDPSGRQMYRVRSGQFYSRVVRL